MAVHRMDHHPRASHKDKSYKWISDKLLQKTDEDTKFFDVTSVYGQLKKFRGNVTPQMEEIRFHFGNYQATLNMYQTCGLSWPLRIPMPTICGLEEIMNDFKEGHITFSGPAGSGKSTLLKSIACNVREKKYENLRNVDVVIFYKAQEFNYNDQMTPGDLLLPDIDQKYRKDYFKHIKKNPEKFLFIIDSLDTLPYTSGKTPRHVALDKPASVSTIVYNLIAGKLLPKCRVISASRENAMQGSDICPARVIALVGLSPEGIKAMVSGYLHDEASSNSMMDYLHTKSMYLMSLCRTPLFLAFTLIGFQNRNETRFKPSTMSGIMVLQLQSFIRSEHARNENIMDVVIKLKQLSYNCIKLNKDVFGQEELLSASLTPEDISDLAIMAPAGIASSSSRQFIFCHKTIQEALAALHVAEMKNDDFMSFLMESLSNQTSQWSMVLNILCGVILDDEVNREAGDLLQVGSDFPDNKECLKLKLCQHWKDETSHDRGCTPDFFVALFETGEGIRGLLGSGHANISLVASIHHLFGMLQPSDALAIGTLAGKCSNIERLSFGSWSLSTYGLEILKKLLLRSDVKIKHIKLFRSLCGTFDMKYLGDIVQHCAVQSVVLSWCELSSLHSLGLLKQSLKNSKVKVIKWIAFPSTNLDEGGERFLQDNPADKAVVNILQHLQKFKLTLERDVIEGLCTLFVNITEKIVLDGVVMDQECRALMQKRLNRLPATDLKIVLEDNVIITQNKMPILTWEDMQTINHDLSNTSTSDEFLQACKTHPQAVSMFEGIQVAHNVVGTSDITEIASLALQLCPMKELELRECDLKASLLKHLNDQCDGEDIHVQKLTVSSTEDFGKVIEEICRSICTFHVNHLSLEENDITDDDLLKLSKHFPENSELSGLDLSYNKRMTNFKKIGKIVHAHSLTQLHLVNCDLDDEDLQQLHKGIGNKGLLSILDVSHNPDLTEDSFTLLPLLMTSQIDRLHISGCDITETEIMALKKSIGDTQKMEQLDISYNEDLDFDGLLVLGTLVSAAGITRLSLAGCNLKKEHLDTFEQSVGRCQLDMVDLSDNMSINGGVKTVATLAKKCLVKGMDLSDCFLSLHQAADFAEALGDFKLSYLNLSDTDRNVDESYTKALCQLIPHVTEELTICFSKLNEACRGIVQNQLYEGVNKELKVKVGYGPSRDLKLERLKLISTRFKDDVLTCTTGILKTLEKVSISGE